MSKVLLIAATILVLAIVLMTDSLPEVLLAGLAWSLTAQYLYAEQLFPVSITGRFVLSLFLSLGSIFVAIAIYKAKLLVVRQK